MMYFKEELLTKEIAVQCETKEQAKALLKWLHFKGKRWSNGESYLEVNYWNKFKDNTCYEIHEGTYEEIDFCKEENIPVISFAEAIDLTKSQIVEPTIEGWFRDDGDECWEENRLIAIDTREEYPFEGDDGQTWQQFTPTDPNKKEEEVKEMSHADIFAAIREGAVVMFATEGNVSNYWSKDCIISKYQICYNYTGTDKDVWLQMKERK